ncbi:MAG: arginine repressor [Desulforudis sp.]|nr:arginine repressor [Clostridia bacterium]MDQ7790563.1 arginine repressor [Clostridia bacterium]RJX18684.1 MAG: arginine repressor [Desulforudis sp.]
MKTKRHLKVLELVRENEITTQEDLARRLRSAGFPITQATISRDIKELGLVKATTGNKTRYLPPREQVAGLNQDRLIRVFRDNVWEVEAGDNLVVIKTLPGAAQSVASAIDGAKLPEILGTVAGDDTIFVAVRSKQKAPGVVRRFMEMLKG